ncbi:addiction module toxin component, YafQ family [Thermoplasmatales archaeon]|nr:addiction module toxin component, YafQ family [Thermoplasmatales archaeon]
MVISINEIVYTSKFEHDVKKVKDKSFKEKIQKQIIKILENPEIGKPLRYALKGERTVRVSPYRIIYAVQRNKLILLRFEHRKEVYD